MSKAFSNGGTTTLLHRLQNWGAVIGSLSITYILHPFLYTSTKDIVLSFSLEHYAFLAGIIPFFWWLLIFATLLVTSGVLLRVLVTGFVFQLMRRLS